jgi:hypothetical protein
LTFFKVYEYDCKNDEISMVVCKVFPIIDLLSDPLTFPLFHDFFETVAH